MKKVEEFITWFFWNLFSEKVNDRLCWSMIVAAVIGGAFLAISYWINF